MSRGWEKSRLTAGTRLRIPDSLFVEPTKAVERLISVTFVGENNAGIMVDCVFKPNWGNTVSRLNHYRIMINWASIWCGHIKVYTEDGEMLRAHREVGMPTIESVEEDG